MRDARKWAGILAGVLVLSLVAAACSNDDGDSSGDSGSTGTTGATGGLSGSITVSGSSTVLPISNLVAELFAGQNPDVQVSVDGPGTGDGFVLFCKGETDISDASRPIEDDEKTACSDAGIDYVELAVAFDGITVMTNPQNSAVTCLNSGDLYALFGPAVRGHRHVERRRLARQEGRRERWLPRRSAGDHGAGRRVRHLRRVHRAVGHQRHRDRARPVRGPGGHAPSRLPVVARRQRDHPGDGGLCERARVSSGSRTPRVRRTRSRSSRSTKAAAASSRPGTRSRTVRTRCRGRSTSTSTRRRSRATPR